MQDNTSNNQAGNQGEWMAAVAIIGFALFIIVCILVGGGF